MTALTALTAPGPVATGPTSTASGPTISGTVRSARGPLLLGGALLLVVTLLGVLSATGPGGRLDPDSFAPAGSRAIAEVLRAGGVEVVRVDTVATARAAAAGGGTLVLPVPQALATSELAQLADLDVRFVVVGADNSVLTSLGVAAEVSGTTGVEQRRPACDLPAATAAGDVDLGGLTYRGTGTGNRAIGCYASGGEATLLHLDRATLLGSGDLLTNDRLDERGNAALALGLLSGRRSGGGDTVANVERVIWLLPLPGRVVAAGDQPPLSDLVADGVKAGALQLAVVIVVLALWRARRLGRVVEEPLPVVVRASEAVEGRGRLYRAAGARGQTAEALRAATRDRLVRRTGSGLATSRPSLVGVLAERTGTDPATLDALLYGAAPADDGALLRLADDLQNLEKTLTQEAGSS